MWFLSYNKDNGWLRFKWLCKELAHLRNISLAELTVVLFELLQTSCSTRSIGSLVLWLSFNIKDWFGFDIIGNQPFTLYAGLDQASMTSLGCIYRKTTSNATRLEKAENDLQYMCSLGPTTFQLILMRCYWKWCVLRTVRWLMLNGISSGMDWTRLILTRRSCYTDLVILILFYWTCSTDLVILILFYWSCSSLTRITRHLRRYFNAYIGS